MKLLHKVTFLVLFMTASGLSNAGLIGSRFIANYHYDDLGEVFSTGVGRVDSGPEWVNTGSSTLFDFIDLGDDYIVFDFQSTACCEWSTAGTYNGWEFVFEPGVLSSLASARFSPNGYGYEDHMISFSGDRLYVNWAGAAIAGVDSVRINLTFSVPEPSALLLSGLALMVAGLRVRRLSARA